MRSSDWSSDVCSSDLGVVGRVDVDALHPAGVERQQGLQGLQVVALDEHVAGRGVAGREVRHFLQQAVGHALRGAKVVVSGQPVQGGHSDRALKRTAGLRLGGGTARRSEEHTSELQSLMRISYAGFCLKKKK